MGEPRKGKRTELLDALTVERAQYVELRSKGAKAPVMDPRTGKPRQSREGALLGNRLPDGLGLYLYITPGNSKSWRFDYRYHGQRRVLVYGSFPDLSLKQARALHAEARLQLARGFDPVEERKKRDSQKKAEVEKAADAKKNTFRAVAAEWLAETIRAGRKGGIKHSGVWKSNTERWIGWANDEFGNKPLPEIQAPDVLGLIKRVAKTTPASAEFCRQTIGRVFRYGIVNLKAPQGLNPAEAVRGAVIVPHKKPRAKLEKEELPKFLSDLEKYEGPEAIKLGLKILFHAYPRRKELVAAKWSELDLEARVWRLGADRMKNDHPFVRQLSSQVVTMFRRLKELANGSEYVFPSRDRRRKDGHIHEQKFKYALERMGYIVRPHGARATAISILEDAGWPMPLLKASLAHRIKDGTDAAYFRSGYPVTRKELAQTWSDMLDGYAAGGSNIVPIGAAKAA